MARTAVVPVRLSPEERAHLYALAKLFGLSLSEFIRRAALKRRVGTPAVAEVNRDTYSELCRIGNNLNQMVKVIHAGKSFVADPKLLAELKASVKEVGMQVLGAQNDAAKDAEDLDA